MFTSSDEVILFSLHNQAITMCKDSNNSVMILIKLMEKKIWAPYWIDQVKATFGLRGSSFSEANHYSVNVFVIQHTEEVCMVQYKN